LGGTTFLINYLAVEKWYRPDFRGGEQSELPRQIWAGLQGRPISHSLKIRNPIRAIPNIL
ncbi:MAG: hypothetical protein KAR20_27715, partial [Candidatus Heimdallarchaeota archaeon]|nr:hypothetical protein [Candidatus Heimdallarchaeota archaeon]